MTINQWLRSSSEPSIVLASSDVEAVAELQGFDSQDGRQFATDRPTTECLKDHPSFYPPSVPYSLCSLWAWAPTRPPWCVLQCSSPPLHRASG